MNTQPKFSSYRQLRLWGAFLGALAVLFSVLSAARPHGSANFTLKIILIILPLLVSALVMYADKFYAPADWSNMRGENDKPLQERYSQWMILALGLAGALLAILNKESWVSLTVFLTAAFMIWQDLNRFGFVSRNFRAARLEIASHRGILAEEASSELVQAELDSMRLEVHARMNKIAHDFGIRPSIEAAEEEFADVEIGRDTPAATLNALMSRYPKTLDMNG